MGLKSLLGNSIVWIQPINEFLLSITSSMLFESFSSLTFSPETTEDKSSVSHLLLRKWWPTLSFLVSPSSSSYCYFSLSITSTCYEQLKTVTQPFIYLSEAYGILKSRRDHLSPCWIILMLRNPNQIFCI